MMKYSKWKLFLLSFCFVSQQALIANATPSVPALYVFGDSFVDTGNNAHLDTPAQANRWPYGIDFNNITGRFTNGKNMGDFIATSLGLPMPPAYLNLSDAERSQTTTGVCYASGSCGILNTTGVGECLRLSKQVEFFTSTATKDLPKAIKDQEKLQEHLANSIYLVFIGRNDYSDAMSHNMTQKYKADKYADILLDETTKYIKALYDVGARKFAVLGISNCAPHNYTEPDCKARYFADKLPQRLQELQSTLPGSLFTMYDEYIVYKMITENPQKYGLTNLEDICFPEGKIVCPDRSKYLKWDDYHHLTQVFHQLASQECCEGKTACSPYNILDLAAGKPQSENKKEL